MNKHTKLAVKINDHLATSLVSDATYGLLLEISTHLMAIVPFTQAELNTIVKQVDVSRGPEQGIINLIKAIEINHGIE